MKESKTGIFKAPIFRETFNDETTVRANNGTPTAVTFSNGVGSFNGTSSYITYPLTLNSNTYSLRLKIYISGTIGVSRYLINDSRAGTTGYIVIDSGTLTISTDGGATLYVNGIAGSTLTTNSWNEIIATTKPMIGTIQIGKYFNGASNYFTGDMDLVEIYDYTLTANEVKNLYGI